MKRSTTESMDKLIVLLVTQLELPLYPLLLTLNESAIREILLVFMAPEATCPPLTASALTPLTLLSVLEDTLD